MARNKTNKTTDSNESINEQVTGKEAGGRSNDRRNKGNRRINKSKGYHKTPASNDITWRFTNADTLKNAASLSWSYATGDPFTMESTGSMSYSKQVSLPGIMVQEEIPCFGAFETGQVSRYSPANIAANALLTFMRSKTRVRNTYDSPDVAMVLGAADQIYSWIAFAKRLAATANMYTYMNRYLPDALFEAQHVNPKPLLDDPISFVSRLNRLISMMNTIYIPNAMSLYQVHTQKYSNYYLEGKSIKDQIYMFVPVMLMSYVHMPTTDYASALIPYIINPHDASSTTPKYGNTNYNTDQILDGIETCILALIQDSDVPDITGDMQNAFGDGNRYIIPMISPDVIATPIFDEEMLERFQNSFCCRSAHDWFTTFDYITQSTGAHPTLGMIIQDPNTNIIGLDTRFAPASGTAAYADQKVNSGTKLLNVHSDPDIIKTGNITRDINYSVCKNGIEYVNVNAQLIVRYMVYRLEVNSGGNLVLTKSSSLNVNVGSAVTAAALALIEPFHYKPTYYFTDSSGNLTDVYQQSDIVATVKVNQLLEMDRLDLLRMLGAYDRFI